MSKKAFTLVELAMTIFLAALLGSMGYFYLNTSTIKRTQYKTAVQSQVNLIESMVFQCKSLSEQFPKELNAGTNASNNLLTDLECNTSTPYAFDGGKNGFVPLPPTGFNPYRATQSGNTFYISITADNNTTQDEALQKLILNYTSTQAVLEHNSTSATFKFYLSR